MKSNVNKGPATGRTSEDRGPPRAFVGLRAELPSACKTFRAGLPGILRGAPGGQGFFVRTLGSAKVPETQGCWFHTCESQRRRRGPLGGATAPVPGGAAHSLHNSLDLHSISKRCCEWLSGVVLGPGMLEKVGTGRSYQGIVCSTSVRSVQLAHLSSGFGESKYHAASGPQGVVAA